MPSPLLFVALVAAGASDWHTPKNIDKAVAWIEEMKSNPRGPYGGISWFCNDGTVLPPKLSACVPHGGGKMYAIPKKEALELQKLGIYVGTVLAAMEPTALLDEHYYRARALIVETYLERALDGWTLKKARTWRGFRQAEDEATMARNLLIEFLKKRDVFERNRSLAARLIRSLPYGQQESLSNEIRALAAVIGDADSSFAALRFKIHSMPEPADIDGVEAYRQRTKDEERAKQAAELADKMRKYFDPSTRLARLRDVRKWLRDEDVRKAIDDFAGLDGAQTSELIEKGAALIAAADKGFTEGTQSRHGERNLLRLHVMGLVEELWIGVTADLARMPLSRGQALAVLGHFLNSARAVGALSLREYASAVAALERMRSAEPSAYAEGLEQVSRVLEWARARAYADVGLALERYELVEPRARAVIDDVLRSGVMLPLATVLDRLTNDLERLRGGGHRLVGLSGVNVAGMRGENPGVAVGKLRVVPAGGDLSKLAREDVVLLHDLPPELPPVAGIMTVNAAGSLSHVSLLARNLGIPHATVGGEVARALEALDGEEVVLGVSAGRRVLTGSHAALGPNEKKLIERKAVVEEPFLEIDAGRIDLAAHQVAMLTDISERDSGVRVGPKAGELGRLERLFPSRVSDAAVIPFGAFVRHVDRPGPNGEPSPIARLRRAYTLTTSMSPEEAEKSVLEELERFRQAIATLPFPDGFESEVDAALAKLGRPNELGVFVRSDTNVEDLKDFTGAGLNKTIANRVGRAEVLAAIREVWASPYSERSYRWRQRILVNPEHVYPSVILHRTVPSEASGVLVTTDLETGARDAITISIGEGVAAVVDGGFPETLVVFDDGRERLIASARSVTRKVIPKPPASGIGVLPVEGKDPLLTPPRVDELRKLAAEVRAKMPGGKDALPWDIEFGLLGDAAYLMQIRPLRIAKAAAHHPLLVELDERAKLPAGALDMDGGLP